MNKQEMRSVKQEILSRTREIKSDSRGGIFYKE